MTGQHAAPEPHEAIPTPDDGNGHYCAKCGQPVEPHYVWTHAGRHETPTDTGTGWPGGAA